MMSERVIALASRSGTGRGVEGSRIDGAVRGGNPPWFSPRPTLKFRQSNAIFHLFRGRCEARHDDGHRTRDPRRWRPASRWPVGTPRRRLDAALADLDAALEAKHRRRSGCRPTPCWPGWWRCSRVAWARWPTPCSPGSPVTPGPMTDVTPLLSGLLAVRDPALTADAVDAVLAACERGAAAPGLAVVAALADRVEEADDDSPLRGAALLERIEPLLGRLPAAELPGRRPPRCIGRRTHLPGLERAAAQATGRAYPGPVRRSRPARPRGGRGRQRSCRPARALFRLRPRHPSRPGRDHAGARRLSRRASPRWRKPSVCARAAAARHGDRTAGLVADHLGTSPPRGWWVWVVEGSFPLALAPVEARLLEASAADVRRAWDRFLITAHGGTVEAGRPDGSDDAIQRFRRYNLAHAAALDLILEIAPRSRREKDPPHLRLDGSDHGRLRGAFRRAHRRGGGAAGRAVGPA